MAARKPSERRHASSEESADLNLVPIMAIMVILIPMLIYMFTFHQIRVQRVSAPRRSTQTSKANEEKKKALNLTVIIRQNKGFTVTWEEEHHQGIQDDGPIGLWNAPNDDWCDKDKGYQGCLPSDGVCRCYDFAKLYNTVLKLRNNPNLVDPKKPEKRINISAEPEVTWGIVSRTIDAVTCILGVRDGDSSSEAVEPPGGFTGMEQFVKAGPIQGDPVRLPGMGDKERVRLCKPLFEQVVFAMVE
jgi:hypothetical protein